jgi:hypothetical protein
MFTGFIWLRIEDNGFSVWTVNFLRMTNLLIKFWRTQRAHLGGGKFVFSASRLLRHIFAKFADN